MTRDLGGLDLKAALRAAREAAMAGGEAALDYWGDTVRYQSKKDGSPVTEGDKASEAAILEVLAEAFPSHSVLTEESGAHEGDARYRWIVDPLDGTLGFTRGGFFWGPLVALEADGEIVAGACGLPVLGKYYWAARGQGCYLTEQYASEEGEEPEPLRLEVSPRRNWKQCTVSVGELSRLMQDHAAAMTELMTTARSVRCYGDAASCSLVLEGRAEVWIEGGVQPWDLGPFPVLLEEAGGRFSDFAGQRSIEGGYAIGSNGLLHDHVLEILAQQYG